MEKIFYGGIRTVKLLAYTVKLQVYWQGDPIWKVLDYTVKKGIGIKNDPPPKPAGTLPP